MYSRNVYPIHVLTTLLIQRHERTSHKYPDHFSASKDRAVAVPCGRHVKTCIIYSQGAPEAYLPNDGESRFRTVTYAGHYVNCFILLEFWGPRGARSSSCLHPGRRRFHLLRRDGNAVTALIDLLTRNFRAGLMDDLS